MAMIKFFSTLLASVDVGAIISEKTLQNMWNCCTLCNVYAMHLIFLFKFLHFPIVFIFVTYDYQNNSINLFISLVIDNVRIGVRHFCDCHWIYFRLLHMRFIVRIEMFCFDWMVRAVPGAVVIDDIRNITVTHLTFVKTFRALHLFVFKYTSEMTNKYYEWMWRLVCENLCCMFVFCISFILLYCSWFW